MKWFSFNRKRAPERIAYEAATKRRPAAKEPLWERSVVVLDAETSGFRIHVDRILSLALLPLAAGRIRLQEMRNWLVFQPGAEANEATTVHGILPEETRGGLPEEVLLKELLPVLGGAILVGHHIRFDAMMLDDLISRRMGGRLRNYIVDTAELAMMELDAFHQTGYAKQKPPALDEVCAQLDWPMVERHTAAGDSFTTAEIFLLLLGRRRHRLGRDLRLGDLPMRRI